jgi:hypothetical protein
VSGQNIPTDLAAHDEWWWKSGRVSAACAGAGVDGEEVSWCRRINKQIGRCSRSEGSLFLDQEKIDLASFFLFCKFH